MRIRLGFPCYSKQWPVVKHARDHVPINMPGVMSLELQFHRVWEEVKSGPWAYMEQAIERLKNENIKM